MAKLTINLISIENLGPFREQQSFDLSVEAKRPVILIKALNGSGKPRYLRHYRSACTATKLLTWCVALNMNS